MRPTLVRRFLTFFPLQKKKSSFAPYSPIPMVKEDAVSKEELEDYVKDLEDDFPEYLFDDMTRMGHDALDRRRKIRDLSRVIALELPRLRQFAEPFEAPTKERCFSFRHTTYLGETHPAASKVVLEFNVDDLELTPIQKDTLIKICGPRYNPDLKRVKMSSNKFPYQAQNKRYLADTVDELLKFVLEGKETFEDVPFDFRHHKPKKRR